MVYFMSVCKFGKIELSRGLKRDGTRESSWMIEISYDYQIITEYQHV